MINIESLPGEWLVALPDHPDSRSVADVLGSVPGRVNHPSGRPWLLGRWNPEDLRTGSAGSRVVATLGFCSATTRRLDELAARASDPAALDGIVAAGSFHLLASVDGVSRLQGSVSGRRRVYRAEIGGRTVAATRADVLAELIGADLDRTRLAVRLLLAEDVLSTVNESLWTGVTLVGEDRCLLQSPDGRGATRRRWVPPADEQPFPQAAEALRTALVDSVAARVGSQLPMSADLSGGLDSTSLCFLAAGDGRPLTTVTWLECDVADEDPLWADRAAEHLPSLSRLFVPGDEAPSIYSDLLEPGPRFDEPFPSVGDRPVLRHSVSLLRQAGSRLHITGDGGDETTVSASLGIAELARRRPWTALRYLRAYRAFSHERRRDLVSALREHRRGYAAWLAKNARGLQVSTLEDEDARNVAMMPPWATTEAVELVRDALLREAASGEHESGWAARQTIWSIRGSAGGARAMLPLYAQAGMRVTSPFYDDNVIDASMAAPAHLRSTPWSYKALLRAAMRGIVPDRSLARTTKTEGSGIEYAGLRANADHLIALCEESRLGRLGLIDPAVLRAACTGLNFSRFGPGAISTAMSTERWLRDLEIPAGAERIPSVTNG